MRHSGEFTKEKSLLEKVPSHLFWVTVLHRGFSHGVGVKLIISVGFLMKSYQLFGERLNVLFHCGHVDNFGLSFLRWMAGINQNYLSSKGIPVSFLLLGIELSLYKSL